MTAGLVLKGPLNLKLDLTLKASGGTVNVGDDPILVELSAPGTPIHSSSAPPVSLPPPAPVDPGPNVWVIKSFNTTVKIGDKYAVAQGMVMQGNVPTWPGMVLPSQKNMPPTAVSANGVPLNVVADQAIIFPIGAPTGLSQSGQAG
jgi:hypothetical protein